MEILVDPEFRVNQEGGRLSSRYLDAAPAVDAMEYESWQKGLAILLPRERVMGCDVHRSKKSWATKQGKRKGRNVVNATVNGSKSGPQIPLNTPVVKEMAREKWGDINHPSLEMIIAIILWAEGKYGREDIVLWKMDISGAFTQVWVRPTDCHLLGADMRFGLVLIMIAGMFGLSEMPFVFEVITRVIRILLFFNLLSGTAVVYVDDLIGVSNRAGLVKDLEVASDAIQILGPDAEAVDKRETTEGKVGRERALVCIGWEINLGTWRVDVSQRTRLKAMLVFWGTNLEESVPLETMEAMASYATRFSMVYRELAFLVGGLYKMQGGRDRVYRRHFTPEAKALVRIWRAYLVKSEVDFKNGVPSGRPMESFARRDNGWWLEFDGCLTGVGVRIFKATTEGVAVLTTASFTNDFGFGRDSSYQNAMELLGVAFALLVAVRLGARNTSVNLRGDSVTVLAWAKDNRFNSELAMAASSLVLMICQHFDIVVGDTQHLSSEDNWVCDELSRGGVPLGRERTEDIYGPAPTIPICGDGKLLRELMAFGNPFRMPTAELDIIDRMRSIHECLDRWEAMA